MRTGSRGESTGYQDGRLSFVGDSQGFLESAFLRDPERRQILRVDETHGLPGAEVRRAPGNRRTNGLRGVAFAVRAGSQHPTQFRYALDGRPDVPLEIGKSQVADEVAAGLFFDGQVTEA